MKIIVVNKYYYVDGGPERYMFSLSEHLRSLGHEVIPFAMAYSKNLPSEYDKYFVPPAGGGDSSKLVDMEGGISTKLRIAGRSVYSFEAKRRLEQLIRDTKPDLIYGLNIVNHMSPSIIDAARKYNVPVVLRLSDYYLTCPAYLYLRDDQICTECENGYHRALRHKCVHGSRVATLCRVFAMYMNDAMGIYGKVGAFISPAKFMQNTLIKAGYPAKKVHHIPTFVDASKWEPRYDNDGYILYFGRLSSEKGVDFLLRSYIQSGVKDPLVIVGHGQLEYVQELASIADCCEKGQISFAGYKSGAELQKLVLGAKFVVVPSRWFDNMPNVVFEAFAAGKPVVATDIGGISEQITTETGILVQSGDTGQLAEALVKLSVSPLLVEEMGYHARRLVIEKYNIETHAERLLGVFSDFV